MGNLFKNPLGLAETVVGSVLDTRYVILYKQPTDGDLDQILSAGNLAGGTTTIEESVRSSLAQWALGNSLEELFTGSEIKYLSEINGYNAFGISYISSDVDITSDLCKHPIETGQVITDNAIINPIKATVRISMPTSFYTRIYEQIESYFTNKTKILLQTKFKVYRNMVIAKMPYKMENSTVDRPQIDIELEQILEAETTYVQNEISSKTCANPSDSDTVDYGRQYVDTVVDAYTGG